MNPPAMDAFGAITQPAALTPAELYQRLQAASLGLAAQAPWVVLDVRLEVDYSASLRLEWHAFPLKTLHIPYLVFVEDLATALAKLPTETEYLVVCNRGNSSRLVTDILQTARRTVVNLEGGLRAWYDHHIFHPVVAQADYQIYQVERVARGCLSYVIISQGQAAVLDPSRHIEHYQQFIADQGARLVWVADTHAHADHLSGGPALAGAANVAYYLHPFDAISPLEQVPGSLNFAMLKEDQSLTVGALTLQVLHTPGHTLGHVTLLAPYAGVCFTGDALFLRGWSGPDLGGPENTWSGLLFASLAKLHARLATEMLVLPSHYSPTTLPNAAGLYVLPAAQIWQNNPCFTQWAAFAQQSPTMWRTPPAHYAQIKRVNLNLAELSEQDQYDIEAGHNLCARESL